MEDNKQVKLKYDCEFFEARPASAASFSRRRPAYAVGVNDVEFIVSFRSPDGSDYNHPGYNAWKSVLKSCYSERRSNGLCGEICEEWKKFSSFLAWYKEFKVEGWRLARVDMRVPEWSPENCVFIPPEMFGRITMPPITGGVVGCVKMKNGKYRAVFRNGSTYRYLGVFNTAREANHAWAEAKMKYLHALKPELDTIDKRLFSVACYEVAMRVI